MPVDWGKSIYLDAIPGEYIIAARKDRKSDNWFVGGVNAETPMTYHLDFGFLPAGRTFKATVYRDADDTDAYTNPETYRIETIDVTSASSLDIPMVRGGGFAISLIAQ